MSKKKGLGKAVNDSLAVMEELLEVLKRFREIPLKKGLVSNSVDDDDLKKMHDKAIVDATALFVDVQNIEEKVRGIKTNRSSRFANAVVRRFLADQPQ